MIFKNCQVDDAIEYLLSEDTKEDKNIQENPDRDDKEQEKDGSPSQAKEEINKKKKNK